MSETSTSSGGIGAGTAAVPDHLLQRGASGQFDGTWFTEEDQGTNRFGMKVTAKLHEERSDYQTIEVFETPFFGNVLTLDGLCMFTERDEFVYHEMTTHVPLCAMPEPTDVLIIGGGDAGCLREALRHPGVRRVVQCDIDERVTRVCERFFPWVKDAIADPRAEVVFEDGVKFIERSEGAFDLVIVDSTDPAGCAVGLFLREFYAKVARALKPGGVMVAQTENPHWNPKQIGSIYREIGQAFPIATAFIGTVPTYPGAVWTWSWATDGRRPGDHFDEERSRAVARDTLYYNPEIHAACFALPNFARAALAGEDPFAWLRR